MNAVRSVGPTRWVLVVGLLMAWLAALVSNVSLGGLVHLPLLASLALLAYAVARDPPSR